VFLLLSPYIPPQGIFHRGIYARSNADRCRSARHPCVPKYKGVKTWGGPFEMTLSEKDALSEAELAAIAEEIKKYL
jgi:hypothetical protein